jgi:hypothetical protein
MPLLLAGGFFANMQETTSTFSLPQSVRGDLLEKEACFFRTSVMILIFDPPTAYSLWGGDADLDDFDTLQSI